MSGRIVGRVFERVIGSSTEKAVLSCLAEHSNPDGEMAFPSVGRIAQETEFSERAIQLALKALKQKGLIEQTARAGHHRPATYRIRLDALATLPLVRVYASAAPLEASGVNLVRFMGAPGAPEPSINQESPKGERSETTAAHRALFTALAKTCKADPKTARASLGKVAKVLLKAGYTPEDVQAFDKWWWGNKGMRQRPPKVWDVQAQIGVIRAKKEEEKPMEYFVPPSMRVI